MTLLINNKSKMGSILAFVHIERSAGTTLINSLRCNYLFKHADVRPISRKKAGIFTSSDLTRYLKINPKIRSIAGHSIVPYGDLRSAFPRLRYVTLMRNPVKRYLSHYRYWIQRRGKSITFDDFLNIEWIHNFQVKKIAGEDNLEKAIDVLENNLWLVGVVERFNEFLLMLEKKLNDSDFKPVYTIVNANRDTGDNLQDIHYHKIVKQNSNDIALYKYVIDQMLPDQRLKYGPNLERDLVGYRHQDKNLQIPKDRRVADFIFRKIYYEPITGLIRMRYGAPYKGSY